MPRRKRRGSNALTTLIFIIIIAIAVYYSWNDPNSSGILSPVKTALPIVRTALPTVSGGLATLVNPTPPNVTQVPTDLTPGTGSGGWWEVYFTDPINVNDPAQWQNSIEGRLIEKINAAQRSIHIVSFEFDLTPVAEALIAAKQRGVDVRWVTDDESGLEADEDPDRGQFAMLRQAGIEVRSDDRTALMHNKFWIFDGQTVWTGSTNITENGIFKQDNNTIVIHSPELAAIYEREFQEMWDGQFGPGSPLQVENESLVVNGSSIQVIFTSEDGALEQVIIPAVNSSQKSIRFLVFSFTDFPLAEAMIERSQNGVEVAGVFEKVGSDGQGAELGTLLCAGVPVRRDGNPSFMHDKLIVVDERFVITGSLNFSTNAETSNDENVILIDNPEIAELYTQHFDRIWAQGTVPEPEKFPCP